MSLEVRLLPILEAAQDQTFLKRWADLEREAIEPNPFFAPEVVLPAGRHLDADALGHLLVAESGERLAFLMPVSRSAGAIARRCPVVLPWRHDYSYVGTPLIHRQEDASRVWTEVVDGLHEATGTSLFVLSTLPREGGIGSTLRTAARSPTGAVLCAAGYRPFVRRRPDHTYLTDWLSTKSLGNLRRKRRELSRRLNAELQVTDRAPLDLDRAVDDFLRLEADGWKGRSGTALLCRPGHDLFFREMAYGLANAGRLLLFGLQTERRVLAQSLVMIGGCGIFGFKKCYDEAYAKFSPGIQLELDLLDWFHRTPGYDWIDSCSATDTVRHNSIFRDRLRVETYAVPATRFGKGLALAMRTATRTRRRAKELWFGNSARACD